MSENLLRCDTVVRGMIITMNPGREVYESGYVAIDEGKIVGVGDAVSCEYEATQELGGTNHVVLPGLVNTHTHLVQGCIRGMAEGTTFEERVFGFYFSMTGACDEDRSYWSSLPPIVELLRSGVTTTTDDHFTHTHKRSIDGVLRAARDTGIRMRMARLTVNDPDNMPDYLREDTGEALEETERVVEEWTSDTIDITPSTIGISYVGPEDFEQIWQWTQEKGTQFDIHAPSVMDMKYLAERRGWTGGCFEWLADQGMLNESVLAIHAQNLRPGEHDLIAESGAKVSLVPDMELLLGLIDFDARPYIDRGIDVSLGLDGPVVSYHHNLWHAAKSFVMGQRLHDRAETLRSGDAGHFADTVLFGSAEEALEIATIGGAKSLGMEDKIGSLEPGKEADLIVIDATHDLRMTPPAAIIPDLVYSGGPDPDTIASVMVGGRTVVERGNPVGIDTLEAVRESDRVHQELVAETGVEKFIRKGTRWDWK